MTQSTNRSISRTIAKAVAAVVGIFAIAWIATMPRPSTYGIWQAEGYGFIIDVSPFDIELYDVTPVSCYRSMRIPSNNFLLNTAEGIQFKSEDGKLRVEAALNPIYGNRLDKLPENCNTTANDDPEYNYEIFWQTFQEQYAFFDLHGVDWDARYAEFRPKVTTTTSDEELFDIMAASLEGLDDGHTWVTDNSTQGYSPSEDREGWGDSIPEFENVYKNYLRADMTTVPKADITYGWLTDEIGYVYIGRMESETRFYQDRLAIIEKVLVDISAEFTTADSIVLDIRFNPGGFDQYALAIAERFATERTFIFSKTTRTATGYTDPFNVYLEPTHPPLFTQPVYLLTSGYTGSGAEIFTLAMRTLPQTTVIGTPTSGGLSDVLSRELPNGWSFGLSNQPYYSAEGELFEGIGIAVDIEVPFDGNSFAKGQDSVLEAAIEIAEANR